MKELAKIVLIVFVAILEVGYADDCREQLYEKYKAHSAEFIRLKNKCKPLFEKVARLADTYRNTVEYKEYKAIESHYLQVVYGPGWRETPEAEEAKERRIQCVSSPEYKAHSKRIKELDDINKKTQAYKAYKEAGETLDIEINAACSLFSSGVYDIDKAFERITKAEHKVNKASKVLGNTPQYKAYERNHFESPYSFACISIEYAAKDKYFAAYYKALETAKKALEPLQTAFRNSPEVKEYEAECKITFSKTQLDFEKTKVNFEGYWDWREYEERQIISYIQSTIANRP